MSSLPLGKCLPAFSNFIVGYLNRQWRTSQLQRSHCLPCSSHTNSLWHFEVKRAAATFVAPNGHCQIVAIKQTDTVIQIATGNDAGLKSAVSASLHGSLIRCSVFNSPCYDFLVAVVKMVSHNGCVCSNDPRSRSHRPVLVSIGIVSSGQNENPFPIKCAVFFVKHPIPAENPLPSLRCIA